MKVLKKYQKKTFINVGFFWHNFEKIGTNCRFLIKKNKKKQVDDSLGLNSKLLLS